MKLVSVGNVIVDILARVPHLPERGADVLASGAGMSAGGSFNTMVAAVRQGLPTAYAGGHGTGFFGDMVRAALRDAGIEVLLPASVDRDSGYDFAMIDDEGERTFVTVFGAEAALDSIAMTPADGDLVHVSGYGLLEATNGRAIVDWLARIPATCTVLLDPGPLVADIPADVWSAALRRADWLSCNEREAALLTGESDPVEAARLLAGNVARERAAWATSSASSPNSGGILIRVSADGCLLSVFDSAGDATLVTVERIPGFAVTAIDTNGAGDAHAGGFLAALAEGLDARTAARRANACAALAVTKSGPATAPSRDEVLALVS